jgi:hypothetical protein
LIPSFENAKPYADYWGMLKRRPRRDFFDGQN